MSTMTTKRRGKRKIERESDEWLWPTALILTMTGWGQAWWVWHNMLPADWVRWWLLLWAAVGVAGVTTALYWFACRWWPVACLTLMAWLVVPSINDLASGRGSAGGGGLYAVSPFLLLLSLGVGLNGAILVMTWFVERRWPSAPPKIRPLRQGLWSGLFVIICGWLLIYQIFFLIPVALMVGALVLIETFFVVRESPR